MEYMLEELTTGSGREYSDPREYARTSAEYRPSWLRTSIDRGGFAPVDEAGEQLALCPPRHSRKKTSVIVSLVICVLLALPVAGLIAFVGTNSGDRSGEDITGIGIESSSGPRSVDYRWYDMFNVSFGEWWYTRSSTYGRVIPLSDSYPYIFESRGTPTGNNCNYTNMRLNITGRNMTEVSSNSRLEFLPWLGTERGGNVSIDWYMQYLTRDEILTRYPVVAPYDNGYVVALNGTVSLDDQAAKAVLNITNNGLKNFDNWWKQNGTTVTDEYTSWLTYEGSTRLDIWTVPESYFQLFVVDIAASKPDTEVILTYDIVSWGMEILMARWIHEAFLPGEWYYEDMDFHARIAADWADFDVDTAVAYALQAYVSNGPWPWDVGEMCWRWMPKLADALPSNPSHPHSDFDKYALFCYSTLSPGSPLYETMIRYDYTPACWNLSQNETLTLEWPAGDQLFRYHVRPGMAANITDEMTIYSEPNDYDIPGTVVPDTTARTLKFVGPVNLWNWSRSQYQSEILADEWSRLGGDTLPYGMPMVDFKTMNWVKKYLGGFAIDAPDSIPANDSVTVTVTALSQYDNAFEEYEGTVNFTCTDPAATLPYNYTFSAEYGTHSFTDEFRFQTEGAQTLTVRNLTMTVPPEQGNKTITVLPKRHANSLEVDVYYIPSVGVPEAVSVRALDQYGDLFVNYTGTVVFSTNRSGDVTLPADYTFQLSDAGVHTIADAMTFLATGWFTITATDSGNGSICGSETDIWVAASPEVVDHFVVAGIKDMVMRQKSDVSVTAIDQYGMLFRRYTGTIRFSANASGGSFPTDYTFIEEDQGYRQFEKAVSFSLSGVFTVTVWDISVPSAAGTQNNIVIQYLPASQTYRIYDMFQQKWGEWWPWRWSGYKTDIVLNNESGKYTMIYTPDGLGLAGVIYAPYRWNITGTNLTQISVHEPEFMPVLGTPDVEGAMAILDVHFQYLDWSWWNGYWRPVWNMNPAVMNAQVSDGWYPGVTYDVVMNRAAAEEWLGMPQDANPILWWNENGTAYTQSWIDWIMKEGNDRLDIWAAFEWPYVDVKTRMRLSVLPDGNILLKIGHLGEGYEILMTRWLNETGLCNHEAYYEDMSLHAEYYSGWTDFSFDAVCQYSLRAVKANESETNEPAWAWEPLLMDYVYSWNTPGGYHPSTFDRWSILKNPLKYTSWNAGDPKFGSDVRYESGLTYFNLTDYQTFIIELPKGDNNLGYYAQPMPYTSIRRIIRGYDGSVPSGYDKYPSGSGSNYNYTAYWPIMMNGTMSLGWYGNWTGGPDLDSMYDPINKTLTMVGPMSFDNAHHANGALYRGAPWIEFNVTRVDNEIPVAVAFATPNPVNAREPVELNGSLSTDPGGPIADYHWTFVYDGIERNLHGQVVQFVFEIPDTYTIELNCTDFSGNYDVTTFKLVVNPEIPEFWSIPLVIISFLVVFMLARAIRRGMC